MQEDFPLSDSLAARMLSEGLLRAKEERNLSMRQIGKQMNYKTSVVLSHMASGRVPIPIDRTEELADILNIDIGAFLRAVLRQRHPDVHWEILSHQTSSSSSGNFVLELEAALGAPLEHLNREQRAIMREVAAEKSPRRRWLSVHELPAVETLRAKFPTMKTDGIDLRALANIEAAPRGD